MNNTLTPNERKLFARALKLNRADPMTLCIEILLRTGMRCEELTKINFKEHVNETRNTIFITAAKGSKNRIVPIDKNLVTAIVPMFGEGVLTRFGLSSPSFKRALSRHFARFKLEHLGMGFKHITLHGLRATFAQAIYEGCENDILLVRDLLGHVKLESTMFYVSNLNFEKKFSKIKGAI